MNDPWSLITAGEYEQAVAAYSAAGEHGRTFALRNRATALTLLKRYDEAFADIQAAEALEPPPKGDGYFHSDGDQVRLGVLEWLSARFEAAGDRWLAIGTALERGRVAYSDPSGGVGTASIMRFAAVRLNRPDIRRAADRLLKKRVKRPTYSSWPLPAGAFYLGQATSDAMFGAVSDTPVLRERQLCQAHFAFAVTQAESDNTADYLKHMSVAASLKRAVLEDEFFLATFELEHGGGA